MSAEAEQTMRVKQHAYLYWMMQLLDEEAVAFTSSRIAFISALVASKTSRFICWSITDIASVSLSPSRALFEGLAMSSPSASGQVASCLRRLEASGGLGALEIDPDCIPRSFDEDERAESSSPSYTGQVYDTTDASDCGG